MVMALAAVALDVSVAAMLGWRISGVMAAAPGLGTVAPGLILNVVVVSAAVGGGDGLAHAGLHRLRRSGFEWWPAEETEKGEDTCGW